MLRRRLVICLIAAGLAALVPGAASGCSPVGYRSLTDLPAGQVFLVGTTGEAAQGGRTFHVERAWNHQVPRNPIVIDFHEGVSQAACGMAVGAGTRMFVAPYDGGGLLEVNLATLLANPESEHGRALIAEAVALYGAGVVPQPAEPGEPAAPGALRLPIAVAVVAALGAIVMALRLWLARRT